MPFLYNLVILFGTMLNIKFLLELKRTGLFTIYAIFYFMLGGILFKISIPQNRKILLTILFLIGLFLTSLEGYVFTNFYENMFDNVNSSFPTVGAILMSLSLFLLLKDIEIKNVKISNLITVIASNCLGVYLFHMYIWSLIIKLIQFNKLNIFLCILFCIFVDFIGVMISIIIGKIPYLKKILQF